MYSSCPKCKHQILVGNSADDPEQVNALKACPACGLIFEKWLQQLVMEELVPAHKSGGKQHHSTGLLRRFLLLERDPRPKSELLVYACIWVGLLIWGLDFIAMDFRSNEIGASFMHSVNLIFHEAGHILFMPFGRTMAILGGSLFQVMLPLLLMGAFLIVNRDAFAGAVCLWWSGQSLLDVAPYIADARALRLPLLGGGTGADTPGRHDWANLLRPRGWLEYDQQIASVADTVGTGVMLLALAWGGYVLLREWRRATD